MRKIKYQLSDHESFPAVLYLQYYTMNMYSGILSLTIVILYTHLNQCIINDLAALTLFMLNSTDFNMPQQTLAVHHTQLHVHHLSSLNPINHTSLANLITL